MSYSYLESSSSSSESEAEEAKEHPSPHSSTTDDHKLHSRIVLCMDVDCFYCQCEELELDDCCSRTAMTTASLKRPIAVGQKHIIVTCNYVARSMGVSKLMSKTDALRNCPSLLIVDGSNLERYRRHSAQIYKALRHEVHAQCAKYSVDTTRVAMKKGGMDEVYCDITTLVDAIIENRHKGSNNAVPMSQLPSNAFVFGDSATSTSATIVLTEDQSGAQSIIPYHSNTTTTMRRRMNHGNLESRVAATSSQTQEKRRLHIGAACAQHIQKAIHDSTLFTTSVGVSSSPMLAKIASDLDKPNGLSALYPWRAATSGIIAEMPLRKVPQLGRSTLKALEPCLQESFQTNMQDQIQRRQRQDEGRDNHGTFFWKCRDLLQVPRHKIVACLQTMNKTRQASEAVCDDLLFKCQGIDHSIIQDDDGGLAKTVSVENSFRRNTVLTANAVLHCMQDLFERLPRLLDDRRDNSTCPPQAYPTTIRLTAAMVEKRRVHKKKRRPFVTKSKQCSFQTGRALMAESNVDRRHDMIQKAVLPLLEDLVLKDRTDINVVRLNIAVTGFQDLQKEPPSPVTATSPWAAFQTMNGAEKSASKRRRIGSSTMTKAVHKAAALSSKSREATLYSSNNWSSISTNVNIDPDVLAELPADIRAEVCWSSSASSNPAALKLDPTVAELPAAIRSEVYSSSSPQKTNCPSGSKSSNSMKMKVDPDVLAELPADLRAEVCRAYNMSGSSSRRTIDQFFVKK